MMTTRSLCTSQLKRASRRFVSAALRPLNAAVLAIFLLLAAASGLDAQESPSPSVEAQPIEPTW
jgi:hypothetical protein